MAPEPGISSGPLISNEVRLDLTQADGRADVHVRRLISGLMALLFLPIGFWTLNGAFTIKEAPHAFVLLIFSGSLMVLVGLAGLVGLLARGRPPLEEDLHDEKPVAQGGGDS